MNNSTYTLHASLIRLAKGMISAWESWVKSNKPPEEKPIENPDPVQHFRQHQKELKQQRSSE